MALRGETLVGRGVGVRWAKHNFRVCNSAAGWYIGTETESGEPYSRETGYMTKREAQDMLLDLKVDAIDFSDIRWREAWERKGQSEYFDHLKVEDAASRELSEIDNW